MNGMEDFCVYSRLEGRRWKEFCSLDLNFYLMILQGGVGQTSYRRRRYFQLLCYSRAQQSKLHHEPGKPKSFDDECSLGRGELGVMSLCMDLGSGKGEALSGGSTRQD